jgi:hypothetical protein
MIHVPLSRARQTPACLLGSSSARSWHGQRTAALIGIARGQPPRVALPTTHRRGGRIFGRSATLRWRVIAQRPYRAHLMSAGNSPGGAPSDRSDTSPIPPHGRPCEAARVGLGSLERLGKPALARSGPLLSGPVWPALARSGPLRRRRHCRSARGMRTFRIHQRGLP